MQSTAFRLIAIFRAILLAILISLVLGLAPLPAAAQNGVSPTAVQTAANPQFASRLARSSHWPARQRRRILSPQGGSIYDNGPINGNLFAWTINFGFVVSDSMTITAASNVTGMTFGAWLFPGDLMETAEISITSEPNGGTSYFDQNVSFTPSNCFGNGGFNVCTETSLAFQGPTLQPGTYWVNLQNAVVNSGDPVYWDQNDGVGCTSPGCPSEASDNSVGTIPSESFTMLGDNGAPPPCFQSREKLQIIHDFTQQERQEDYNQSGVTIDSAGNLYGTTPRSGNNGAGFAFKLARFAGWLLDPLFNFSGGSNGGQPSGVIVGPNGSLYGGAQGGIQNCGVGGSEYCGLVFNLRPRLTACPTTQCTWTENVPYRFIGESDGSGIINISASDNHGNLYGTTASGGAFDAGTVFELTPSGRGWTKTTLYSFTGGDDGVDPTQVLAGNDGNLYGVADGGALFGGVVFQLKPTGGQWTQSVLHAFSGGGASYLVQDGAGNLYGISNPDFEGVIFTLQKNGSGWTYEELLVQHEQIDLLNNLAIDAAGNLYGTGGSGIQDDPPSLVSYIFKAGYDARHGWHYSDVDYLGSQTFPAGGSLALDPEGNLYGTTSRCGANGYGTIWQLSP